jgi:death on curing protein
MRQGEPDFLTLDDVLEIAAGILPTVEIRDIGLLESAVARPQASVFGELAYPDLTSQAGALLHSLARNHPLIDGNKRLAWSAMRVFLLMNDFDVEYDIDDAERMVLDVAQGLLDVEAISSWLDAKLSSAHSE